MTKIILVPIHYANLFDSNNIRGIIAQYKPDIIGIEETQKDTDALLEQSQSRHFVLDVLDKLYKQALFTDNKTVIYIAKGEKEYYCTLFDCINKGIKIIGCDSDEFRSELYKDAIEEYTRSKKHFLKEVLKLPPNVAKEKIAESYYNILSTSSSEDLLHKGLNLKVDSKQLREYYEKRDTDTANRIVGLAKDNDGTIMYFCNITHFNPTYRHLEFLLSDLEPEIVPIYGPEKDLDFKTYDSALNSFEPILIR